MGLGDAYDSYLEKRLPMSNITVERAMELELQRDHRDVNTIINACLDMPGSDSCVRLHEPDLGGVGLDVLEDVVQDNRSELLRCVRGPWSWSCNAIIAM